MPTNIDLVRVFHFIREYMGVLTRGIADSMPRKSHLSKSLVSFVERGERRPTDAFVAEYADALQKATGFKRDIVATAKECANDCHFMELLTLFETDEANFFIRHELADTILEHERYY